MNIRTTLITSSLIAASLVSGTAQAALQGRDLNGSVGSFEAYYDTDLDITWLADANYAKTSGYDSHGLQSWADTNTWAASLSLTDTVNNITYDNWRLPTVNPVNGTSFNYNYDNPSSDGSTDYGYNISEQGTAYAGSTGSEMAHLFYNTLDNKGLCDPALSTASSCSSPQPGFWGLTNLHADSYWSGSEYAPGSGMASFFNFSLGVQHAYSKNIGFYALAVSPGDVGAVPEADTWVMLLAGLTLVGAATRRRRG